jgi:hypothetical protein
MKEIPILIVLILLLACSCGQTDTGNQTVKSSEEQINALENIKQVAATYHDLKATNVDVLFTEDFIGRGEDGHTWDRENHRRYLSNDSYKVDSIQLQVAEGNWVATMFSRTMEYMGDTITVPIMHFKRFEGDKIAEVWEYYDYKEEQED